MAAILPPGSVLREDLASEVTGFVRRNLGLIGIKILPPFMVNRRNGEFYKIAAEAFLQRFNTKRSPGARSARSNYAKSRDTWNLDEYSNEDTVEPANDAVNRDLARSESIATERVLGIALRDYENDVVTAIQNETTFPATGTTGATLGTPWSTAATATPITDVFRGVKMILDKTGLPGNFLQITYKHWQDLSLCTQILDRLRYAAAPKTEDGLLPLDALKAVFGVPYIFVASGRYNSANDGLTAVNSGLWSDTYAFVGRIEMGQDVEIPQLGRTLKLSTDPDNPGAENERIEDLDGDGITVFEYNEPQTKSKVINATLYAQPKVLTTACGYLLKTVN